MYTLNTAMLPSSSIRSKLQFYILLFLRLIHLLGYACLIDNVYSVFAFAANVPSPAVSEEVEFFR